MVCAGAGESAQILGLVSRADRYFRHHRPDAVVLIDYPGMNWWIARRAKVHGIPVYYYAPPQIWAWATWRAGKMRRLVDHALCSLPFEEAWLRQRGCKATYVGHPFFDEVRRRPLDEVFISRELEESGVGRVECSEPHLNLQESQGGEYPQKLRGGARCARPTLQFPLVLILPGSRTQEIVHNLPWFLAAAERIRQATPGVRFAVGALREKHGEMSRAIVERHERGKKEEGRGGEVDQEALTPGTAEGGRSRRERDRRRQLFPGGRGDRCRWRSTSARRRS